MLKADIWCKLLPFLGRGLNQAAAWIQVFITFDRYIFVAYPKRFQFAQTRKFIISCVLVDYLISLALNVPNLLFSLQTMETKSIVNNLTVIQVTNVCNGSQSLIGIRDNITSVFRLYLPCLLIMIGNHLLIRSVRMSKMRFNKIKEITLSASSIANQVQINNSNGSAEKKEQCFMNAIIAMDIVYLITLVPQFIVIVLWTIFSNISSFPVPKLVIALNTAYYMLIFSAFASLGFPFLINLKYNRIFKSEFKQLLSDIKSIFS